MSDQLDEVVDTEAKIDIDPRAMEKELLAVAEARAQDPSEMAAMLFQMYVPHFKAGLSKLSTRGLRRVLQNAVLYPLEQDDIRTSSEFEKQMVQLVSSLLEAKFIMILDTYKNNAQELYDASQAELTPEQEAEIKQQIEQGE